MYQKSRSHFAAKLWALPAIVAAVCIVILAFNPGCLNEDAIDQYEQAVVRHYVDWHPATMSILWSYLLRLYDGIQSMLSFSVIAFSVGLAMIVQAARQTWVKALIFFGVIAVPPVFAFLGMVVKDTVMGTLLVLGIGAYYSYRAKRNWISLSIALIAMYLACAVRQNGIIMVSPILCLLFWEYLIPRGKKYAILLVPFMTLVTVLGFFGLLKLTIFVYDVAPGHPEQGVMLYDLAALSTRSGRLLAPAEFILPGTTVNEIRAELDPFNAGDLFWGGQRIYTFQNSSTAMKDLRSTWLRAIWDRPIAYLRWRTTVFETFAGLEDQILQPFIESCIVPNSAGLKVADTQVHRAVTAYLMFFANSLLFRLFFYLLLLLATVGYGIWRRRADLIVIGASAFLYATAYFFLICQSTFRFASPSVLVAIVLVARILSEGVISPDHERSTVHDPSHKVASR